MGEVVEGIIPPIFWKSDCQSCFYENFVRFFTTQDCNRESGHAGNPLLFRQLYFEATQPAIFMQMA
jgi:hypothetical protein